LRISILIDKVSHVKIDLLIRRVVVIIVLYLFTGLVQGYAQGVSMHTQGILQQEFLNPAYNSFKDYTSVAVYNRAQWGQNFTYNPKTYVVNFYMPINKTSLGTSLEIINEDIGLRKTTELKMSLCYNLRISQKSYLAFGYSVGFLQNRFDWDKVISYPDENLSHLLEQTNLNTTYPAVSVGAIYLRRNWFVGLSSMTTAIKKNMDKSSYLPGLDFSCGTMVRLSPSIRMRPLLIVKYYDERGIISENGVVVDNYRIPILYDVSANFLFFNKFWLGTSHRVNQAQTFSLDMLIGKNIKMGYTFELGIGEGLNQFNSYGFRLAYTLKGKHDNRNDANTSVWMRHRLSTYDIASYIY